MISTWSPESQSVRDMPQRMKDTMGCSAEKFNETVENHPTAAVMIGLGIGFATGMLLACAYRNSSRQVLSRRNYAQKIGDRVMDSLRDVVPSQWTRRTPW